MNSTLLARIPCRLQGAGERRKKWAGGLLALALTLISAGCNKSAEPAADVVVLNPVPIDGVDVAVLLQIVPMKYSVAAPPKSLHMVKLWAERFQKGNPVPEVIPFPGIGTGFDGGNLLFQVPWYRPAEVILQANDGYGSSSLNVPALLPEGKGSRGYANTGRVECLPGKPAILAKGYAGGPGLMAATPVKSMIADNDVSVILYISVTPFDPPK